MSSSQAGESLRITEIFHSLQGETSRVGLPTTFIRLTGCPLRCHYCDTAYAFTGGQSMQLQAIVAEVKRFKTPYVTVTGGEPLIAADLDELCAALRQKKYHITIETAATVFKPVA